MFPVLSGVISNLYGIEKRHARFHPLRDIFARRFASSDIGVATAVYYASSHLSRLRSNSRNVECLQLESVLRRSVISRLSSQRSLLDETIIAILGMIAVDVQIWVDVSHPQRILVTHLRVYRRIAFRRRDGRTTTSKLFARSCRSAEDGRV